MTIRQDGPPQLAKREREAAHWFARCEAGEDLDELLLPDWDDWMADDENRAAYARIAELHLRTGELAPPRRAQEDELIQDLRLLAETSTEATADSSNHQWRKLHRPLWRVNRAAGSAIWVILITTIIGLIALLGRSWSETGEERQYATAPGEQREFVLSDGSIITLGGDTSVSVRFTHSGRLVTLGRGEGMFRAQGDVNRPFSVCAQSACVTAVGTIFDVHLYTGHVRVWVQQGAVDVRSTHHSDGKPSDPTHWTPVRLHKGQELTYDPRGLGEPRSVDASTATAWTHGSLVYRGRPLAEVVEDVQRYSSRHISVDPAISGLLYSGSVIENQVDQWMLGLGEIFPVQLIDCRQDIARAPQKRVSCADQNATYILSTSDSGWL